MDSRLVEFSDTMEVLLPEKRVDDALAKLEEGNMMMEDQKTLTPSLQSSLETSCITCCCPCVTFGQNVKVIDKGNTSCACAGIVFYLLGHFAFNAMYACTYRSKLRGQFSIPGDQCADFCIHCCCPLCAICQEHRELVNRGLDPSKGNFLPFSHARISRASMKLGLILPP
ncbi:hypothetical protein MLD38_012481 [Melastoma candidum]|uniref:Uncharacterized protein n=1 Tax=Melastoma candidum TaxID=119954 RepID=A0ACB9RA32_9MYRT|nr:hypothetical protein MLD38_012481 [Melastoma candidum]